MQNAPSKVLPVYRMSTGSIAQLFDYNYRHIEVDGEPAIEQNICQHCTSRGNCHDLHISAMRESMGSGRSQIYQCELGLLFWVCPIFNDGAFSGALRGSGYLDDTFGVFRFAGKCNALCNQTITPEQFARRVLAFPFGNMKKIQSLAEMLLLCAESLSSGNKNHHETLRLRSEQQASLSSQIDDLRAKYPPGSALPGYPLEKERQLISFLRRGNKKEAGRLLDEVLASLVFISSASAAGHDRLLPGSVKSASTGHFKQVQLRALELAVLLARSGANSGSSMVIESNARDMKQIQEAKTIDELAFILHSMVDRISLQIVSFQGLPHASIMRKAENFIREHYTRKISLREIAGVVGLSAPYFSTIFKEEMGENLSRYINRLRVEKASKLLLETELSLSEIAGECCFEDQSWFSKIFKSFTGISPGKYRNQGGIHGT